MVDSRWTTPIARGRSAFARLHFRTLEEQVIPLHDCEVYQVAEEPPMPLGCPASPDSRLRVRVITLRLREVLKQGSLIPPNQYGVRELRRAGVPEWARVEMSVECGRAFTRISWREYHEEKPVGWWAKRRDLAARRRAIGRRVERWRWAIRMGQRAYKTRGWLNG